MMGHAAVTPPPSANRAMPWRRSRRRPWHRLDRLASPHAVLATIPSLPRAELARITERLIDRMDELDGDSDVELNGDERDGTGAEDDFCDQNADWLEHPGCPVSDPGEDNGDHEREKPHE